MLNLRKATFFKLLDIILNDDNTIYNVWYNRNRLNNFDNIPIIDIIRKSYKTMHYESDAYNGSYYYSTYKSSMYKFEIYIHITDYVYINFYMYDI